MLFEVLVVLASFLFALWVVTYTWFRLRMINDFPRHVDTNKRLTGPFTYFIFGVNPFSHKPTQIHWRFREYCEQYGDFFGFAIFNTPAIGIGDPKVVNELMNNKNFTMRMYPPLFDRYLKNRGILFTNDMPHWKVQRAAASKGIMKTSHLKKIAVWTNITTDRFLERLHTTYGPNKFEILIDPELSKLALDVIGQAAFSIDVNSVVEADSKFTQLVTMVMNMTAKYTLLPPWIYHIYYPSGLKKGEDALISLRDVVRVVLDERKKAGDFTQNDDLLDILLTYQQHGEQPLSDDDIILTCWDMFIAGHETTAHSLAWIMYFLGHHPEIQEEVYQEIVREIGNATPDFENIKQLTLCHNVIKESLRLRPVVPVFTRISPTDQILNNYLVKANTPIMICNSRLHCHPQYWDDPHRFNPHRWEKIENSETLPYRPFGFGERACVGSRMTFIESKVVLAKFLRKYRIMAHNAPVEEVMQITMAPRGLKVYLEAR